MIDFTNIKGNTIEGQRSSFEQLICHLARLDGKGGEFRRIEGSGGDGGVEAIRILPTEGKIGYQAKYYPLRENINWNNLNKSVETALQQHPELERYVIALPCDFTGKRAVRDGGSTDGIWGKWDKQVNDWKTRATTYGMSVVFELWTAFEIEAALLRPDNQHLLRFFFDQLTFSREWMQRHLDRTTRDLHTRYSPDEHVDTSSLKPFDVIFRRENVCQDLQVIFDAARGSSPREAADLIEGLVLAETDLIAAEDAQSDFLSLGDAVNWDVCRPWPVCDWLISWYSLTRSLLDINDAIRKQIPAYDNALREKLSETTKVYSLIRDEVFAGRWAYILPIDGSRATLLVGRAGAGKSHALARGVEIAWKAGAPVIHILGQHVLDDDPRISILKRLEIAEWSFHDALWGLNLAAEAAGTRALVVIDALNEGRGTDVWRSNLASFIQEINEYDRIVLVVSCREEYLDYVVPPEIIADPDPYPRDNRPLTDCAPLGKLVQVSVEGFRTTEEREAALQKFMDEKGIVRPTAPVLDTEFFNPLFMSSVCRSMAQAGMTVFPRGLHGARDIFEFVLETKAKALGTHHDGTMEVHKALLSALNDLAGYMVKQRTDNVPIHEAINLVNSAFEALPINGKTWLSVLEGSDILRRDVEPVPNKISSWSKPNEVVRFTFQRLQDNLITEWLIDECHERNIENVFEPGAPFAFLVERSTRKDGVAILKFNPRWVGVLGALWSVVAEKYGKELYDLSSFFGGPDVNFYLNDFRPVYQVSIRERKGTAFTARTREILNYLWEDGQAEKLTILLSTSCVPGHAWSADSLAERLLSLSAEDRTVAWSDRFTENSLELNERATEIINWALNVKVETADDEVVRLAGITLTCLLTVTNTRIREQASKGLMNLLANNQILLQNLRSQFHNIDDPIIQKQLVTV